MSREQWGRGSVYRRGRIYWIRYPNGKGQERRESSGIDPDKARRLLERRLVEVEDDRLPAQSKERRRTVNDLIDALVADYTARNRDSARNTASTMKAVRKVLGSRRAGGVTTADLTNYILERRAAGAANETIGRQLRHLKQAFGLQSAIPTPKFPQLPKGKPRDVLIAPADQRRLVAAISDPCYRDATQFKLATGWRGIEVIRLQWKHIRDDSIRLVAENSKTDEARDFPLVGTAADIIERRIIERKVAPGALMTPFVFQRNGRVISYSTWRRIWQEAAVQVGLGTFDPKRRHQYQGVNLHDCRRAFATDSVNAGIDPQTVRTLSGHKSNSIFDRYRILKADVLAQAVQRREEYVALRAGERKVVKFPHNSAQNPHN